MSLKHKIHLHHGQKFTSYLTENTTSRSQGPTWWSAVQGNWIRCYLLFYCISYRLNMFRALLFPSPRARDCNVDYHIDRFLSWVAAGWKLGAGRLDKCPDRRLKQESCYSLQPGHYSSLPAPNFQRTATQEPDDQCGNQHSRELLMMGIVVPETCWAYKKYNKIISSL